MEPDFSGYATKAGLLCSDGRTIMAGAFRHQHEVQVPLVWQHGHNDPELVLGHAILHDRDGDVYANCFFNKTPKAQHARQLVENGDINMLSIWANDLVERGKKVLHGAIREVSLVLSGANPGARIDYVAIRHSDGLETELDDEAIIFTGLPFSVGNLSHADGDDKGEEGEEGGETIQDIYEAMSDKQKDAVHYMIGQAVATDKSEDKSEDGEAKQDNVGDADDKTLNHDNTDQEGSNMTRTNVFEKDSKKEKRDNSQVLSHAQLVGINADAMRSNSSLRETIKDYAVSHGIENLEVLFPEAKAITQTPEWDKRRTEWVAKVLGGANKTPFSRVKTWTADLTFEQARAKGYIKTTLKKEEFFAVARRITTPQTIYKKQKLDRDDIIDITDFDVVAWMKGEMRLMLDEELARAVLVGDGREVDDDDKIQETNIRPIAKDDPFYTISIGVNVDDANSSYEEVLDTIILNRRFYKGSGNPTLFTTEEFIANVMLLRDDMGRKLYRTLSEVATELRVSEIVPVEILEDDPDILAILVNMNDYTIGADRGGQVTMFDDFDIDYNQEKYLIETRVSGALTKPKSAMVVYRTAQADVAAVPTAPGYDSETWTVTVPTVTGVEYRDQYDRVLTTAEPITLDPGTTFKVTAYPADGYYFTGGKTQWSYLRPTGS